MRRIITAALAATTLAGAAFVSAAPATAQPYWRPYPHPYWGRPYGYWGPRPYWGGDYGPGYYGRGYWGWRRRHWRGW